MSSTMEPRARQTSSIDPGLFAKGINDAYIVDKSLENSSVQTEGTGAEDTGSAAYTKADLRTQSSTMRYRGWWHTMLNIRAAGLEKMLWTAIPEAKHP